MIMTFVLMGILVFKVAPFNFYMDYLRWFSIFEIIGMGAVLSLVVGLIMRFSDDEYQKTLFFPYSVNINPEISRNYEYLG